MNPLARTLAHGGAQMSRGLADLVRLAHEELSEWAAAASYLADDYQRQHNAAATHYHRSRSLVARSVAADLRALCQDLDTLLEVEATRDAYVRALEQLRRGHHPEVALKTLVFGPRVVRRRPRRAKTLSDQVA